MDLPLCKICGDRHRLGGCPQFNAGRDQRQVWLKGMVSGAPKIESPAKADQHPQAQGAPQAQQEAPQVAHETQKTAIEAGAPVAAQEQSGSLEIPAKPSKAKFDKNAYQRELMRRRRAAEKETRASVIKVAET